VSVATVIQIIKAHLVTIGADGLVLPDAECGCELADLAPCGGVDGACEPGYRGADQLYGGAWAMYRTREAADASLASKEAS
jgi:hypothetical protein